MQKKEKERRFVYGPEGKRTELKFSCEGKRPWNILIKGEETNKVISLKNKAIAIFILLFLDLDSIDCQPNLLIRRS